MPSLSLIAAAYAQATGRVLVPLLTLSHPSWPQPVRLAGYPSAIVSRGQTYSPFPVDLELPAVSKEGGIEPGRISVPNVTRDLVPALRSVEGPIGIVIELVFADQPDTVEVAFPALELSELAFSAEVIEAPIAVQSYAGRRYPADDFSPALFPGLAG